MDPGDSGRGFGLAPEHLDTPFDTVTYAAFGNAPKSHFSSSGGKTPLWLVRKVNWPLDGDDGRDCAHPESPAHAQGLLSMSGGVNSGSTTDPGLVLLPTQAGFGTQQDKHGCLHLCMEAKFMRNSSTDPLSAGKMGMESLEMLGDTSLSQCPGLIRSYYY